jgi:hypothetical protein
MPKTITSPVAKFPGSVVIADPMTYPGAIAFERAWKAASGLDREQVTIKEIHYAWIPGLCANVLECHIEGYENLTPENFPASPSKDAANFASWLIGEVLKVYGGGENDPND